MTSATASPNGAGQPVLNSGLQVKLQTLSNTCTSATAIEVNEQGNAHAGPPPDALTGYLRYRRHVIGRRLACRTSAGEHVSRISCRITRDLLISVGISGTAVKDQVWLGTEGTGGNGTCAH